VLSISEFCFLSSGYAQAIFNAGWH